MKNILQRFSLDKRVAIITGGSGLLGIQHAEAIAEAGGIPVIWDIQKGNAIKQAERIEKKFQIPSKGMYVDITVSESVKKGLREILSIFNRVDILINNAANDPKVSSGKDGSWSRFENYALETWNKDITVGLQGA